MACYLLLFIFSVISYIIFLALRSFYFMAMESFRPALELLGRSVRSIAARIFNYLAPSLRAFVVGILNMRSENLWKLSGYLMLGFTLAGFIFSWIHGVHH